MRRYCKSIRNKLLHEFSESNLSLEDFCEEKKINKSVIELAISESMETFAPKELKLAPVVPQDFVEVKVIDDTSVDIEEDESFTAIKSVDEDDPTTSEEFLNLKIGNKAYLQIPVNLKKKKLVHILKAVAELWE